MDNRIQTIPDSPNLGVLWREGGWWKMVGVDGGGGGWWGVALDDAHVLLQCPLLPGNSRVDVRINYWFNGSMTKNVKEGLGDGGKKKQKKTRAYVRSAPHLRCEWEKNQSVSNEKRIYKEHLHPSQLFTSSAHKSATR